MDPVLQLNQTSYYIFKSSFETHTFWVSACFITTLVMSLVTTCMSVKLFSILSLANIKVYMDREARIQLNYEAYYIHFIFNVGCDRLWFECSRLPVTVDSTHFSCTKTVRCASWYCKLIFDLKKKKHTGLWHFAFLLVIYRIAMNRKSHTSTGNNLLNWKIRWISLHDF